MKTKIDPLKWDNDPGDVSANNIAYEGDESPIFEVYYREGVSAANFNLDDADDRAEWEAYQAWKKRKKLP